VIAAFGSATVYEKSFQAALLTGLHCGDVVWDVGANVGFYSRLLANRVGLSGVCYSFEPSALNRARFESTGIPENVILLPFALGESVGTIQLIQGSDPLGATSFVVENHADSEGEVIQVECMTGDLLVANGQVPVPQCIKIDVEGYEWEVLQGLRKTLANKRLFRVGLEVHFATLAARGHAQRPREIEFFLQEYGYGCRWIDYSHLLAERTRCEY
jgi:FkbM family methyltransferase